MAQTGFATQPPVKAQVEALFDSLALEYVRERERQFSFIAQKRIVIEMLGGVRGRLLEVGCGPAVMAPELAATGFEVCGIDVSTEMIRRAGQRMAGHPLEKRCKFAVGDMERLQFPNAFFDAVLAMGVLEYLPSYAVALRETVRVLKPGGSAVFTVPNRACAYRVARSAYDTVRLAAKRALGRGKTSSFEPNRCLPWTLDRQLADAGLRKVDSAACNFIFFPLKEIYPRGSDSLSRALMPLARAPLARVLGAQYLVKVQKAGWR
jgi:ubiquinone/menaquinone biosynthesis C-methylase UbiE